MQESRVIRFPELCKKIGVSRSTIFRWERDKKFPSRFKLGENSIAWLLSDVENWLAMRAMKKGDLI
jgi:prophage regulatory protein